MGEMPNITENTDLRLILALILINFYATSLVAENDFFRCDRISASSVNLKKEYQSPKGLNKVFPLELKIVISKDKKWAASFYGVTKNRSANDMKLDIITFKHMRIDGKLLRSSGDLYARIISSAGHKHGIPAKYKCDKATKTNWSPEL